MSDFQSTPLKMALLRLCRITNELTETDNCYSILNRQMPWVRNSVYIWSNVQLVIRMYNCNANKNWSRILDQGSGSWFRLLFVPSKPNLQMFVPAQFTRPLFLATNFN